MFEQAPQLLFACLVLTGLLPLPERGMKGKTEPEDSTYFLIGISRIRRSDDFAVHRFSSKIFEWIGFLLLHLHT